MSKPSIVLHRYSFLKTEKNQTIWLEIRSITKPDKDGRYDWTVWIKAENMEADGIYRDRRATLVNMPSDYLVLLAAMRPLIESLSMEVTSG